MAGGLNIGEGTNAEMPLHMVAMHHAFLAGEQITDSLRSPTDVKSGWSGFNAWMNVADEMKRASTEGGSSPAASPYNAIVAYDPDADLDRTQERFERFDQYVEGLRPSTTLPLAMSIALDMTRNDLIDETRVSDAVDAAEQRGSGAHMRAVGRLACGLWDIRAVQSTQFHIGLAALESDRLDRLHDLEAQLRLDFERMKHGAALQLVGDYVRLESLRLQSNQNAAAMQQQIGKERIIAKQDQQNLNLQYELRDVLWDLDLFQYGNATLGAISSPALPKGPSKEERMLGLALGVGAQLIPFLLA